MDTMEVYLKENITIENINFMINADISYYHGWNAIMIYGPARNIIIKNCTFDDTLTWIGGIIPDFKQICIDQQPHPIDYIRDLYAIPFWFETGSPPASIKMLNAPASANQVPPEGFEWGEIKNVLIDNCYFKGNTNPVWLTTYVYTPHPGLEHITITDNTFEQNYTSIITSHSGEVTDNTSNLSVMGNDFINRSCTGINTKAINSTYSENLFYDTFLPLAVTNNKGALDPPPNSSVVDNSFEESSFVEMTGIESHIFLGDCTWIEYEGGYQQVDFEANYWDTYMGSDNNGDGYGDTPHEPQVSSCGQNWCAPYHDCSEQATNPMIDPMPLMESPFR